MYTQFLSQRIYTRFIKEYLQHNMQAPTFKGFIYKFIGLAKKKGEKAETLRSGEFQRWVIML